MFVLIGKKEYRVRNCGSTLSAIVHERDWWELEIANPDELVKEKFTMANLQIVSNFF